MSCLGMPRASCESMDLGSLVRLVGCRTPDIFVRRGVLITIVIISPGKLFGRHAYRMQISWLRIQCGNGDKFRRDLVTREEMNVVPRSEVVFPPIASLLAVDHEQ